MKVQAAAGSRCKRERETSKTKLIEGDLLDSTGIWYLK